MTEQALPAGVRALLRGPVTSMAHVEALLLLRRVAPDARPLAAIAVQAQLPTLAAARRCLDELTDAGLVTPAGSDEFRYAPPPGDARDAVDSLAQMYNEKPVTLVRAIYSRLTPPPAVQAFADAFRLRRDD